MKLRTMAWSAPGGQAVRREIDRFVEAEAAFGPDRGEARVVLQRPARIDHRRQTGGVGRDDAVFAETALQAQARHAEVGILVGHLEVAGVVGGFRDAPGNAERRRIALLARRRSAGWSVPEQIRRARA